jgi:predicted alpha-1,2-mannosidase
MLGRAKVMVVFLVAPLAGMTSCGGSARASVTPSTLVDTFMGTGVGGSSVGDINTFPGADTPFGMMQWSPDTSPDRQPGGGYAYRDQTITGFSLTHLSGPGCSIYGDIPILPTVGSIGADPAAASAHFSHTTEDAHPGSYAVSVGSPPVRVELAVTTRTGLGRFTFPAGGQANLLFKAAESAYGSDGSSIAVVGSQEVDGSVTSGRFCDTGGLYHLYFAARFDRPFTAFGVWQDKTVSPGSRMLRGPQSGAYVSFGTTPTPVVEAQVGISFVSVANAQANLAAENPGWDLGRLRARAAATWDRILGHLRVSGGTVADQRTFYSALYRSLLHPNVFEDANGQYPGFDNRTHVATGYTDYTNFTGWDLYRSEIELQALVAPQQTSDMVTSLLADATQGGALPKSPVAGSESAQIAGDNADPIIASAYAFGARSFDVSTALRLMVRGATVPGVSVGGFPERQDLAEYLAKGYIEADRRDITSSDYTIGGSETLEYAIDDFAIAQLSAAAGDAATTRTFLGRAQNWKNLINAATGWLSARGANGTFPPGPAFQPSPLEGIGQDGWEEGNSIQYTWSVPENLRGLFDALGGNAAVVSRLDTFFTHLNTSRKEPYDWAGDEPSFGIPWEYDYAGAPWRTQDVVRLIANTLYLASPNGEPGNDDLGAMSAWYVWAALGVYPEVPGRGELVLASPLFPHVTISLAGGRALVISAPEASAEARYVQAAHVRGITAPIVCSSPAGYVCPWLPDSVIRRGGRLDLVVGPSPNRSWGSAPAEAPPSFSAL